MPQPVTSVTDFAMTIFVGLVLCLQSEAAAFRGRFGYLCLLFLSALSQLTVSAAPLEYTVP